MTSSEWTDAELFLLISCALAVTILGSMLTVSSHSVMIYF